MSFFLMQLSQACLDQLKIFTELKKLDENNLNEIIDLIKGSLQQKIFTKINILQILDACCEIDFRKRQLYLEICKQLTDLINFQSYQKSLNEFHSLKQILHKSHLFNVVCVIYDEEQTFEQLLIVHDKNSVEFCILNDEVERIQEYDYLEDKDRLIKLAAKYGSENCYQFLKTNEAKIDQSVFEASFIGGNKNIIFENFQKFELNDICLENAIRNHRNEFIELFKNFEISLSLIMESFNLPLFYSRIETLSSYSDALHVAASYGIIPVINMILDSGAKVDVLDKQRFTPLMCAIQNNQDEAADVLISRGANIEYTGYYGRTPLIHSLLFNANRCIDLLLTKNVEINKEDNKGQTALFNASYNGNVHAIQVLIDNGAEINHLDASNNNCLHKAADSNSAQAAQILIDNGANIAQVNSEGQTPVYVAVSSNHINAAEILVKNKANLEIADSDGFTPLCLAAMNNFVECAKILIENGANVNAQTNDKRTPLIIACQHDNADVLKIMLQSNAEVDTEDQNGNTALIIAAKFYAVQCLPILLEYHPDVSVLDPVTHVSVAQLARESGFDEEIIELILDEQNNRNPNNIMI